MKKTFSYFLLVFIVLSITSCDDILEEDISNDIVHIISPTHGSVIEGNTVQFSWQPLQGADNYRIQLLANNQAYVLDSLVSINHFIYSLNPGEYQWRIKGENFAYQTQYTFPASFIVEASNNLSNQLVILETPNNNFYTNQSGLLLTWNSINSADHYTLELIKSFNGQQTIFLENNITETMFSLPSEVFDEDAEYIWKVKAVNSISETVYSQRSLFIDRVVPNQPALVSPSDQQISSSTVSFNWTIGPDMGNIKSPITNTIEISSDINFGSLIFSSNVANNSYQYKFENPGSYYWRVRVFDSANNIGDYSSVRLVTIQ